MAKREGRPDDMSTAMVQGSHDPGMAEIEAKVAAAVAGERALLLAVSGGRDSMVMMHVIAKVAPHIVGAVATFDHGTGAHAARAAALAAARASALGWDVVRGRAERPLRSEAALREVRWTFFHEHAARLGARVATAHTRDDQLETVVMRILRDTGARGLAALYANTGVTRPMIDCSRAAVAAWAAAHRLEWVEDPSNLSRRFLRNRLRLDLIPALVTARPELSADLLALARRAAGLREEVDAFVTKSVPHRVAGGVLIVAREALLRYDSQGLALIWQSLAARAGVTLDRRGTVRVTSFTTEGLSGGSIQLSGGVEVVRHRDELRLRRAGRPNESAEQALTDGLKFDRWLFRRVDSSSGLWSVELPAGSRLAVRAWQPGDRMVPEGGTTPRRVKGFFANAGVDAAERRGWPVVLVDDQIEWVPGVRRGSAATARSGRPVVRFACERVRN